MKTKGCAMRNREMNIADTREGELTVSVRKKIMYAWKVITFLFLVSSGACVFEVKAGDMYGLVIGIDDYIGEQNDLAGAVNDANDIEKALRSAGAVTIIKLVNGDATKNRIESSYRELLSQAQRGDLIVLTYSGHGSQEPEPPGRNGEEDGLNENFLLAGYQPSGEGTRERIVDDEIFLWLQAADNKGIQVIFVADSCHSGTMHRKVNNQSIRYRKGIFRNLINDLFRYPGREAAQLSVNDLPNVTFVSATSDDRLTPEVNIEGEWRGALSWAFARALEGGADRNQDGEVSQFELLGYVVPAVHALVERQQTPQILPIRASSRGLFQVSKTGWQSEFSSSQMGRRREARFQKLKVAVENGSADALQDVMEISVVKDKSQADLVWNIKSGEVLHRIGGKVADNISEKTIRPVLAKWNALLWLKAQMARDPVVAKLVRGNHRYPPGSVVEVEMAQARYPYLTIFNLPPNGRVELLIPPASRPDMANDNWSNKEFRNSFLVDRPPFGAEHLVAIYSDEVLAELHASLTPMSRPENAVALRSVLEQALDGNKFQTVVLDIYTGNEQ